MRRLPLVVLACLATPFLISAAAASEPSTYPEIQARLNERAQALTRGLEGLAAPERPATLQADISGALAALPNELTLRATLRRQAGMSDDAAAVAAVRAPLAQAGALQAAFWRAPAPNAPFLGQLRETRDKLLALLGASAGSGARGGHADRTSVRDGVANGARALACARGAFDGGACGADAGVRAGVPGTVTPVQAGIITVNSNSLASGGSAAPILPPPAPLTPESANCVSAVNGPDPANPQHSSIAAMCRNSPTMAPLLAGLLDAVKEQFGTVSGILLNLLFLLLGVLMAVATGGVALLLKLLAIIGAGIAIMMLIGSLVTRVRDFMAAPAGSPARASALRAIGNIAGSILIMAVMALVGFKIGKTPLGQSAARSMESGMTAALDKIGGTALMEGINSRLPAGLVSSLERVFGKAPERPGRGRAPAAGEVRPPGFRAELTATLDRMFGRNAAGVKARVAAQTVEARAAVADELTSLLGDTLSHSQGNITRAQYNQILQDLRAYAGRSGIQVNPGRHWLRELMSWPPRMLSVEPKGLSEIDLVAFGRNMTADQILAEGAKPVGNSALHELFHVIHTIQLRATLARAAVPEADAILFARMLEGGGNYRELEYAATRIGNPFSRLMARRTRSGARYTRLVNTNIRIMEESIGTGAVRVPGGWTIEEMYAFVISKAPILLGDSFSNLLGRMSITYFGYMYWFDVPLGTTPFAMVDQDTLRDLGLTPEVHFREFINTLVTGPRAGSTR